MFSAIASANPILTWIFIEATTLSTVFLISFYNKPSTIEAAWKYLIINSIGLLLAFFGTSLYLAAASPLLGSDFITWQNFAQVSAKLNPEVVKVAFIFVFIGYGTKLGIAPMHTWRPDAYSKAPIAAVVLLSGALMNVALLTIMRFTTITNKVVGAGFSETIFIFFGVLSLFIAAFSIFKQENYKRLLAYSSIEHAGIMLLGLGFGGLGIYAGLLHMVYHSLAKSAMFLLTGNISLKYNSRKIQAVSGMIHALPKTGILFMLGFLSLTGMPPFGTFLTKFYILSAGMSMYPFVTILVIFLLALIFFGFFKQVSSMLFGQVPEATKVGEYGILSLLPQAILLSFMLYLSFILPGWLQDLLQQSVLLFTK
jgi:hydrogenase-4 component F